MPDINKFIVGKQSADFVEQGHLTELKEWDESLAEELAAQEGIELSSDHWQVIHFLRSHHIKHGLVGNARELTRVLSDRFAEQGGNRYLFKLFPNGPVIQASRIAGLPIPTSSIDPSFGSVH